MDYSQKLATGLNGFHCMPGLGRDLTSRRVTKSVAAPGGAAYQYLAGRSARFFQAACEKFPSLLCESLAALADMTHGNPRYRRFQRFIQGKNRYICRNGQASTVNLIQHRQCTVHAEAQQSGRMLWPEQQDLDCAASLCDIVTAWIVDQGHPGISEGLVQGCLTRLCGKAVRHRDQADPSMTPAAQQMYRSPGLGVRVYPNHICRASGGLSPYSHSRDVITEFLELAGRQIAAADDEAIDSQLQQGLQSLCFTIRIQVPGGRYHPVPRSGGMGLQVRHQPSVIRRAGAPNQQADVARPTQGQGLGRRIGGVSQGGNRAEHFGFGTFANPAVAGKHTGDHRFRDPSMLGDIDNRRIPSGGTLSGARRRRHRFYF